MKKKKQLEKMWFDAGSWWDKKDEGYKMKIILKLYMKERKMKDSDVCW
jgi:hypothetical protein